MSVNSASAAFSASANASVNSYSSIQNNSGYKPTSFFGSSVHSPKTDETGLFDDKLKSTESLDKDSTDIFSFNAGFEETAGEMANAAGGTYNIGFEETAGEVASLFSTSGVGFEESAGEVAMFGGGSSNSFFSQAFMGPKPRFEIAAA